MPTTATPSARRLATRPADTLFLLCILCAACSAEGYRKSADDEVYRILSAQSLALFGEERPFTVERPPETLRARLLEAVVEPAEPAAEEAAPRLPRVFLDLRGALETAAENSRDFQRRKEVLYLTALALTRQRWEFATRFDGGAAATVSGTGDESASGRTDADLSARRLLAGGTRLVASFVNTFVRSFTSGGGWDGSSLLALGVTQPLLRGFGRDVVRESLTQAERNVVYELRDLERFRRELCVRIAADYYGVLQQIDGVENARRNLESLEAIKERNEELGVAGRLSQIQVDQAGQDLLRARDRLIRAVAQLETVLDRFKLTLGLPPELELELDQEELERLRILGVQPLEATDDEAILLALTRRLDLRNTVDEAEDAARRIAVARDALRAGLDLSAVLELPTEPDKPLTFDPEKLRWRATVSLDLPLDRLPERNAFRSTLINEQAQLRRLEEHQDVVKQQVRLAVRRLAESLEAYQVQQSARALAEVRVEAAREMLEAGRAQTRDILEAQEALLNAQNAVTAALVGHVISRLELLRDLEALVIGPEGLVYDTSLTLPGGEEDDPPPGGR